ncbi:hypothetical protein GWK48_07085 [Metallosphaera tengchongensis]|uniref:Uncharacterized protein n=1 Tax=Metallosphaera tengchongensis TaxID=1532350 RepID=A0A6N0NVD6_9CREN|nr:hypothetical protein [Metallosphaera tengchongensis]QKR00167.1 hypothetical protein GWK48_07085 [Metallosphaera tengchongensis]
MDRLELLNRALVEGGFTPKSFQTIERGVRVKLFEHSFLDLMDSGIVLIYVSKSINCEDVLLVRDRIKLFLPRLRSLDIVAGVEVFANGCFLSLLKKFSRKLDLERIDGLQINLVRQEYFRMLKIMHLLNSVGSNLE